MINHRNHLKMLKSLNDSKPLLEQKITEVTDVVINTRDKNGKDSREDHYTEKNDNSDTNKELDDKSKSHKEALKTQNEFLDQQDSDILRIAADTKKETDDKQIMMVTTPSCEATDGPQRRSVLQKGATVKASPESFDLKRAAAAEMIQAGYRVRLSPISTSLNNQVLIQDSK